MSGEHTFGASDDIVRRIRENLPHIEWEQPLSAERERLAADEIERLRAALRYIERPTMSLGDQDPEQHVLVADEIAVRIALQTCIRMAREALAVEEARRER